jgi:transcription elongation factor GreA
MEASKVKLKEHFSRQLVLLDENRSEFLDLYFPYAHSNQERKKMDSLIAEYTRQIGKLLRSDPLEEIPQFVFIGSTVTCLDLDHHVEDQYTICFPEESDPDNGLISFLSPVGQQLLLAKVNHPVTIETPNGKLRVFVSKVSFHP